MKNLLTHIESSLGRHLAIQRQSKSVGGHRVWHEISVKCVASLYPTRNRILEQDHTFHGNTWRTRQVIKGFTIALSASKELKYEWQEERRRPSAGSSLANG